MAQDKAISVVSPSHGTSQGYGHSFSEPWHRPRLRSQSFQGTWAQSEDMAMIFRIPRASRNQLTHPSSESHEPAEATLYRFPSSRLGHLATCLSDRCRSWKLEDRAQRHVGRGRIPHFRTPKIGVPFALGHGEPTSKPTCPISGQTTETHSD